MTQMELNQILNEYHVQPVGNGYIDCICPMENAAAFTNAMSRAKIRITQFTWWCHVTEGHKPCGMGGPKNKYGTGWYSEICMGETFEFSSNEAIKRYLFSNWPKSKEYKSCYVPAFWLSV